jgi:ubiquinone/menaquinone biosynthesis C-methylase UbiE
VHNSARWVESAYDEIAAGYDERWSVHIRAPQQKLTKALDLKGGMRCADLGCGTGVDTIDMAKLTAPEPVHAVDCSAKMLEEAANRARARGLSLNTVCVDAESFIASAEPASFDVLSLRFCLAYLPWREIVPPLARVLRPNGRLGILTNLGTSAPQAYEVYREMVGEGVPAYELPVPKTLDDLTTSLRDGGFRIDQTWTHSFKLWFDSGRELADWLAESGFVTHAALSAAPEVVRRALWDAFASRMERKREGRGIPLDFDLAGVIATNAQLSQ